MTTLIDLPDNCHALLRESSELTNRQVKELRRAARRVGVVGQRLRELGLESRGDEDLDEEAQSERNLKAMEILSHLTDEEDDSLDLFQRVAVLVRLVSWTVLNPDGSDRPLPTTVEEVDDLPRPVYAAITTAASDLDLSEDFTRDGMKDPKADTDDSEHSKQPSEEVSS